MSNTSRFVSSFSRSLTCVFFLSLLICSALIVKLIIAVLVRSVVKAAANLQHAHRLGSWSTCTNKLGQMSDYRERVREYEGNTQICRKVYKLRQERDYFAQYEWWWLPSDFWDNSVKCLHYRLPRPSILIQMTQCLCPRCLFAITQAL